MKNCQIQKIVFFCLTFPNILFHPNFAFAPYLEQSNKSIRIKKLNDIHDFKIKRINYFFANLENIKHRSSANDQKKSLSQNINSVVNEIFIESKVQSEKDNILYANGEVIVKYKGNILKADRFSYDKKTKLAKAEGNIQLKVNDQIFQADLISYDFVNKKGTFENVKGLINSESIISDFNFKSDIEYKNFLSTIPKIKKDKIVFTPDKVINWLFAAETLKVDQNKWSSQKAFFTNDLLDTNQIKFQFNGLEIIPYKKKLKLKSKINYLIFKDKIYIPYWTGDRTIYKDSDNRFFFNNRWKIGYDDFNKDGYFIGRRFNPIRVKDDLFLNLEPQFLFQRAFKGTTKSFVKKNYPLNSPRVERNISLSDYFALNSVIEGNIKNWNLRISKDFNTFDLNKFANAFRTKAELSRKINLFNDVFTTRIYGGYRERVWNGSIGESEIYTAYGWKLDKANNWNNGSVSNNQTITLGLGKYKAEALNTSDYVESYKGIISYELNKKINLTHKTINTNYIDNSYEYIPKPIQRGVFINTSFFTFYNLYNNGNYQRYVGIGLGPEFVIGNFKKDFFDYTRLSVLPIYKLKGGQSIFKFDQVPESFTVDLKLDQHLFGSWLIETKGTMNLDKDSDTYGQFIYSRIGMHFQKRSYSFGIFYQPHDQARGIKFTLNGFM